MGFRGSKRHFAIKGVICWLWQRLLNWGFAYLDSISRGWFVTFRGCGRICVPWGRVSCQGEGRITRFHDPWAHYSLPRAIPGQASRVANRALLDGRLLLFRRGAGNALPEGIRRSEQLVRNRWARVLAGCLLKPCATMKCVCVSGIRGDAVELSFRLFQIFRAIRILQI